MARPRGLLDVSWSGLKQAAQKLESRDRQQAVVVALGRTALEESEHQALFNRAAKAAAEQLDCEFSEVLALLPGRGNLLLRKPYKQADLARALREALEG